LLNDRVPISDSNPWEAVSKYGEETFLSRSPSVSLCLDGTYGFLPDTGPNSSKDEDYFSFLSQQSPITPLMGLFRPFSQDLMFNTSVTFSYYPFLKLGGLTKLQPDDVRYLEMKGCLHVPSRPSLDKFIRQYFLHVHPCMPILDEGEFWDMYSSAGGETNKTYGIPLLVFQAMLFTASTVGIALPIFLNYAKAVLKFVPLSVLKDCGFETFHLARETFHQRAKVGCPG
jgi:hypothetical protein